MHYTLLHGIQIFTPPSDTRFVIAEIPISVDVDPLNLNTLLVGDSDRA